MAEGFDVVNGWLTDLPEARSLRDTINTSHTEREEGGQRKPERWDEPHSYILLFLLERSMRIHL